MAINDKSKKNSSGIETIPFNVSKLTAIQYVKFVYADANKELHEIKTEVQTINNETIQLRLDSSENVNITYPIGVVLKIVTYDALYFAKAVLKDIIKINNNKKLLLIMDAPKKIIRQQNRKHCRIVLDRPCILSVKDDKNDIQSYIAQTVNISMGGILIYKIESITDDNIVNLQLNKGKVCHLVLFLEHDFKIKLKAKFVRSEYVDDFYRYGFIFIDMPEKYINPLNKYITNEQLRILKENSSNIKNRAI